jgi:hypothetical protein
MGIPDGRRRLLVNEYETAADIALGRAADEHGVRIFPKVLLRDAINLRGPDLTEAERRYGFTAHLDFVVAEHDGTPLFAVEIDGPQHHADPNTIARDRLKNAICTKRDLPLLRTEGVFLRPVGNYRTILEWLTDVFLNEKAFYAAQARGEIPEDEPFMHFAFLDSNFKSTDPFLGARASIQWAVHNGYCRTMIPSMTVGQNPVGYCQAIAVIELGAKAGTGYVMGKASVAASAFPEYFATLSAGYLAEELAVLNCWRNLVAVIKKEQAAPPLETIDYQRRQMAGWTPCPIR